MILGIDGVDVGRRIGSGITLKNYNINQIIEILRYFGEKNIGKRGDLPEWFLNQKDLLYMEDIMNIAADKLEECNDLAERRLNRKNMYKERSERSLFEKERYRLDLERTQKELEEVENKLSELLCYITGGRFSKTGYSIQEMKSFADDYLQDTCNKCDDIKEFREELLKTKRELHYAIDDLCGMCSACKNSNECTKYPCYCINGSAWEWRGVPMK